jgi:hypothetical protein
MTTSNLTPITRELVELAAQEGHDADIPSNAGVVITRTGSVEAAHIIRDTPKLLGGDSTKSPAESISDKDIEKGLASTATPVPHDDDDEKPQPGHNGIVGDTVGWDSETDGQNPMNWPAGRKWGAVSVVAAITFLTPLGSSIFAPGVPAVMAEFGSDSELLSGFVLSVYVLGFAFGPLGTPSFLAMSLTDGQ